MPRSPEYRYLTGDIVRTRGRVFGRVEGWSGRDLVLVRITDAPLGELPLVGQIAVYAADELALIKPVEVAVNYFWEPS